MSGALKLLSPVAMLAGVLGKKKPKAVAAPLLQQTPRANSAIADALSARRGALSNQRTGATGAESSASAKKTLMGT